MKVPTLVQLMLSLFFVAFVVVDFVVAIVVDVDDDVVVGIVLLL